MKFKDLPIGTKFIVENTVLIDYFTKLSEYYYNCSNYVVPLRLKWHDTNTDECYPILMWEDEELLND